MFYVDEINPQCKGNLSYSKTTAYIFFIHDLPSHSCEWLKHTRENGGTPPYRTLGRHELCRRVDQGYFIVLFMVNHGDVMMMLSYEMSPFFTAFKPVARMTPHLRDEKKC